VYRGIIPEYINGIPVRAWVFLISLVIGIFLMVYAVWLSNGIINEIVREEDAKKVKKGRKS
jgi:hypothetical protein